MTKFTNVIVRRPAKSMVEGITSAPELGKPDYELACKQHDDYIAALKDCGVEVTVLPALEQFPDSCFVEDPAVITRCGAIITNPGAASRNGEKDEIEPAVRQFFDDSRVKHIVSPGTLDGGDVMMVGDHFYVGRSARTNEEGIRQFFEILEGWGLEGSEVPLEHVLHLKTGVNYLEDGNMLVSGEFVTKPDFGQYHRIEIPEDEAYAANCIWVNGTVIVPEGYPAVLAAVQDAGYETITVDTSEYRKLDGGLSCLSLRFYRKIQRPEGGRAVTVSPPFRAALPFVPIVRSVCSHQERGPVMNFIIRWLVTAVAVGVAVWLVPGMELLGGTDAWVGIAIFGLILSLVNISIKPIMQVLSLPISVITLGIFYLVVNTLMLYIAAWLANGIFQVGLVIDSFGSAFVASIVISIVSALVNALVGKD